MRLFTLVLAFAVLAACSAAVVPSVVLRESSELELTSSASVGVDETARGESTLPVAEPEGEDESERESEEEDTFDDTEMALLGTSPRVPPLRFASSNASAWIHNHARAADEPLLDDGVRPPIPA